MERVSILLVEDNPNDVEIMRRAFEKEQIRHELIVASDGQSALDLLHNQADASKLSIGLILLDLNLPKVDGISVLKELKADQRLRRVPVIVLTASSRDEDIVRSYDFGVNTFISKPVRFDDFVRMISTIKEYWLNIADLPVGREL